MGGGERTGRRARSRRMRRELTGRRERRPSGDRPMVDPTTPVVARSARLAIRRFATSDLADLVELHNDPLVMRFLNNGRPVPDGDVIDELTAWIDEYGKSDGFGCWAMNEAATDRFVGWIHFRPGHGVGELEPELGFRLHRACWGQGFATEASCAMIDRGFTEQPIERVYAQTMAVHRASRRVMEKAGMRMVRMFTADWPVRIPGDEYGDVEYAVTRAEWIAARSAIGPAG